MQSANSVFQGACVHCHDWSGVSQLSPFATIARTRGVNDRTATNVVQIVISGTTRHTPGGVLSMPAFGDAYSDTEIAAVVTVSGVPGSGLLESRVPKDLSLRTEGCLDHSN